MKFNLGNTENNFYSLNGLTQINNILDSFRHIWSDM